MQCCGFSALHFLKWTLPVLMQMGHDGSHCCLQSGLFQGACEEEDCKVRLSQKELQ